MNESGPLSSVNRPHFPIHDTSSYAICVDMPGSYSASSIRNQEKKPPAPYARAGDWDSMKGVLYGLYMDRNLTLEDVANLMEQRHNFRATYVRAQKGDTSKPSQSH